MAPRLGRPLGAKLAVERLRVVIGARRETEAHTELTDEMRDAPVPDLFRDAGYRELARTQAWVPIWTASQGLPRGGV